MSARVAHKLGIPHYVLDYETRFARDVIAPFAQSYLAGETPIPCVACNQTVKFRDLLATARELGALALATGHYIERREGAQGPELYRAADGERDQSYFLFSLHRRELDYLRFPLGGLAKSKVRELAREWSLPVADKADSQDICFVPSGRYASVIERLHPEAIAGGEIVDGAGRVLGQHGGIIHFTIGQRKGLGIATGEPLYVVRLDAARRQVVVGPRTDLRTRTLMLRDVNWLGDPALEDAGGRLEVHARIRSTHRPVKAWLVRDGASAQVELAEDEYGVAPGQACVLYADGSARARVLGGGTIAATGPRRAAAISVAAGATHLPA